MLARLEYTAQQYLRARTFSSGGSGRFDSSPLPGQRARLKWLGRELLSTLGIFGGLTLAVGGVGLGPRGSWKEPCWVNPLSEENQADDQEEEDEKIRTTCAGPSAK